MTCDELIAIAKAIRAEFAQLHAIMAALLQREA